MRYNDKVQNTEPDNYPVDESQEISLGSSEGWTDKLAAAFPAMQSRNYQLYFFGQLVSMIGTWLQIVAEGWLVYQLTHSAFYVGLDAAAATIPSLFLSLFGGVIVDKFPKRTILFFTQTAAMILAFALGVMTLTGTITVWWIILLAFLLGVVNAVNTPALQSYVVELVDDKAHLASAIALGAGMFNAARAIGPTVAGLLIAYFGVGIAFMLNGASYLAIIISLYFIKTGDIVHSSNVHPLRAIQEGITYTFKSPIICTLLLVAAMVSVFGWSYSTLMPVIAQTIFHVGAAQLGYLYAAGGAGAFVGAIVVSIYAKKISAARLILAGLAIFGLAVFAFTFVHTLILGYLTLFFAGFGLVAMFSMTNTTIQHAVEDHMRGRVMSIYALAFLGFAPLGNLEIGFVAEKFGTEFAIRSCAIILAVFWFYLYGQRGNLKIKHDANFGSVK